jgi:hypothetical protein
MKDRMDSLFVLFLVTVFCVFFLIGAFAGEGRLKGLAAATECARFHPDTGKFEWLKEKSNELTSIKK